MDDADLKSELVCARAERENPTSSIQWRDVPWALLGPEGISLRLGLELAYYYVIMRLGKAVNRHSLVQCVSFRYSHYPKEICIVIKGISKGFVDHDLTRN